MAQIINEYRGLGDVLGEGLGQGLAGLGQGFGGSLQQLANMKLNQFAQRQQAAQTAKAFQQLPGITPEIAQFLGALSPEERKYPLQNLGALMQLGAAQQGQSPMATNQMQPQSAVGALQGLSAANFLSNPNQVNPLIQEALSKALVQQPGIGAQSPLYPPAQTPQAKEQEQLNVALGKQAPTAQDQAKLIEDIFTSPQEKRERHKLALKEKQVDQQEKAARFKETKKERAEIAEKARSARTQLHDLERMEELERSGKLDTPGYVEFLKRSGLDIPALLQNPESEEFQKIAVNFLRDAKQYFGARISNYEVEQFLKTIPSLSQSPEGRKRVISNLKYLSRGNLAYNEALKDILKDNEGVPPYDLLEQIDDRIENKLDKIAEKFKDDLARPVPKGEPKLITALGALLGSGAGFFTSLAGLPGAAGKFLGRLGGE